MQVSSPSKAQTSAAIHAAAAALGAAGGRAKSARKAKACRENGKKGGRPRKAAPAASDS